MNRKKLVIDIGNTLVKAGIFQGKERVQIFSLPLQEIRQLPELTEGAGSFSGILLSTVVDYPDEIRRHYREKGKFIELDEFTPLPLLNLYETPATLGKDRIAAAVGGHLLFPEQEVLVINAGTCITYDVVTARGHYLGGCISPGVHLRLKALHTFTGRLPLVSPAWPGSFPGRNTTDSILGGVLTSVWQELEGMIELFRQESGITRVVLSGGDRSFFENQLKSDIFVVENIVLPGLNEILDYNV